MVVLRFELKLENGVNRFEALNRRICCTKYSQFQVYDDQRVLIAKTNGI
jgi:hypothetical protein